QSSGISREDRTNFRVQQHPVENMNFIYQAIEITGTCHESNTERAPDSERHGSGRAALVNCERIFKHAVDVNLCFGECFISGGDVIPASGLNHGCGSDFAPCADGKVKSVIRFGVEQKISAEVGLVGDHHNFAACGW